VAIAVGIGVKAATREGLKHVARQRRQDEHDAIAAVVSDMRVGESRAWGHERKLGPDAHGEVRVLRVIETPLTTCKEIAFSLAAAVIDLEEGAPAPWFTTVACREGDTWKWALAEPAVDRWGNLQ
jgi:hypothetical protein